MHGRRSTKHYGRQCSELIVPVVMVTENGTVTRMAQLATGAPALDWNKLDQIAALPLGGRVKLNPWDDKVEIVKAQPVAITSARDKMPFEVTPFYPRLTRYSAASAPAATTAAATDSTATTATASQASR